MSENKQKSSLEKNKEDYWKIRRRLIIFVLGVCYILLTYLALNGVDGSVLHQKAVTSVNTLSATAISSYIGVAVYDDVNMSDPSSAMDKDEDFWFVRRLLVLTNVAFTFCLVGYLLVKGDSDSYLQGEIISNTLFTCTLVIAVYTGAASISSVYMKKLK